MKKLFILFISALFLFSLMACSGKKAEESKAPVQKVEKPAHVDTTVVDSVKAAVPEK